MSTPPRPAHFLLAEDEQAHADLIMMSLEDNFVSNTIDHVMDGEAAIQYLKREGPYAGAKRPDIILLDLKLPKLDGHEVLARIKNDDALRAIPVVILTTSASESDRARAYHHYANGFLQKPVDFDKFQQMVRDLKLYWTVWNQPAPDASSRSAA